MTKRYVLDSDLMKEVRTQLLFVKEAEQIKESYAKLQRQHEMLKTLVDLAEEGQIDHHDINSKLALFIDKGFQPEKIKQAHYTGNQGILGSYEDAHFNVKKKNAEEEFLSNLAGISSNNTEFL